MGNGCRKQNTNVYFQARKEAAEKNDRLSSREGASELLGVSESTLADYELGNTKVVPVDKVVLMADLYRCPELKNRYCKCECPIGKALPIATEAKGIEGITIQFLNEFNVRKVADLRERLLDIAKDGVVDASERSALQCIGGWASDMEYTLNQLRLTISKIMGD